MRTDHDNHGGPYGKDGRSVARLTLRGTTTWPLIATGSLNVRLDRLQSGFDM